MKKAFFLFNLIFCILILSSCWGKLDINKLTTASAIGIDKSEKGFKVTIQAVNSSSFTQELTNRASIVVYSEEGETVYDALRKLTKYYPSRIFMSHFQLLVFGEEFARSGVEEVMGFLYTDVETRQKFNLAVVKGGTASDLLKIITPLNPNPATEVNSSIQAVHDIYGAAYLSYIDEFLACLLSDLNNPVLTGIEIEGDIKKGSETKNVESTEVETKLTIVDLAVFKSDKLIGWLNEDESKGFNFLIGSLKSTIIPVTYGENKKVSVEISGTKTKNAFKLIDKKPTVNVSIKMKGIIGGLETGMMGISKKEIQEIEKNASDQVMKDIESCLKKAQDELNTDFLRIGALIHRQETKYWQKIRNNIYEEEVFKNIEFIVKVETKITNTPE